MKTAVLLNRYDSFRMKHYDFAATRRQIFVKVLSNAMHVHAARALNYNEFPTKNCHV